MTAIPEGELEYRASRAGGPGGQHVNKTSTRIEVRWNVATSAALDPAQRQRLLKVLAQRIDGEGWLRTVASDSRSQLRNREAARERLIALVEEALVEPKARRKTKTPARERAKRLKAKRLRAEVKATRRRVRDDE